MHQRESKTRRGFILVMTLMLLAIAAVALAAVGRSSMGLAVSAVRARQDLQQRWGMYSSRHAVLELAPILLKEAEESTGEPVVSRQMEVQRSGHTYDLTVSDEQAKANINAMLQHHGRDTTRTFIREQLADNIGAGEVYLPTHKPSQDRNTDGVEELDRAIISLNHLLPDFNPATFMKADGYPMQTLTCWGDGRINLSRAPDELVEDVTKPELGAIQIRRLRETLASSENMPLEEALISIELSKDDVPAVLERLTLESSCYSVWVAMDNGKRSWHELSVLELEPDDAQEDGDASTDINGGSGQSDVRGPNESLVSEETEADSRHIAESQAEETADPVGTEGQSVFSSVPAWDGLESTAQDEVPKQAEEDVVEYPRLYLYQW